MNEINIIYHKISKNELSKSQEKAVFWRNKLYYSYIYTNI